MPGQNPGPSIHCPTIYEALRRKGYAKSKAAAISNAVCNRKKTDEPEDDALLYFAETLILADTADVPDRCFGYAPDGQPPSARKLPLCDANGELNPRLVSGAATALGPDGYRGQQVDIPDADLPAVIRKVKAAWRKAYPDKKDSEMPAALKAAEPDVNDVHVDAPIDSKPTRDYLAAFVRKIKELAGGKLSDADIQAAHKHARSSAGGKASGRKRRSAVEIREHYAEHPQPIAGCDLCVGMADDDDDDDDDEYLLPKNDPRVNYRIAAVDTVADDGTALLAPGAEACGNCRFYQFGACSLVEGTIEADDVCDLFLPQPKLSLIPQLGDMPVMEPPSLYAAADARHGTWSFFSELPQAFAQAPDWINVLPKPGIYTHPSYGQIAITPERNARFVQNFDAKVYQQTVPISIDLEHDGKMSGAQGYFEALRQNADGSVDARVTWTDRGRQLIEEDRFRYFSPEWWDEWPDPATGQRYQDVLIGGALCIRPFFKEDALRPLVASEGRIYAPEAGWQEKPGTVVLRPLVAAKETPNVGTVQLTEEQLKELTEAAEKGKALESELSAVKTASEAKEQRIAALEGDARRKRFTDVVMGKGGESDGAPWLVPAGKTFADHVKHLEDLAAAVGEDSEVFKDHVATAQAMANQTRELMKPLGDSRQGDPASAVARIEAKARAMTDADKTITKQAAVALVAKENPDLYAEYERELATRR